jgi:hypothetical protein
MLIDIVARLAAALVFSRPGLRPLAIGVTDYTDGLTVSVNCVDVHFHCTFCRDLILFV